MDHTDQISYLLSFLMILICRAGGKLDIPHLSEFAGKDMELRMNLDKKGDVVHLSVIKHPDTKLN